MLPLSLSTEGRMEGTNACPEDDGMGGLKALSFRRLTPREGLLYSSGSDAG